MAELYSTHGQCILVDDDIARALSGIHIHLGATGKYPMFVKDGKHFYLHRFIMGVSGRGDIVDHINGDIYDNRRQNLRVCNKADNAHNMRCLSRHNSSGYKGVYFETFTKKWRAQIQFNGARIRLGRFETPIEAAEAYDKKAKELFGEYACTNADLRQISKQNTRKVG